MKEEKEVEIIDNEKEISDIIKEKIKCKKVIYTDYYWYGIDLKGISHERVKEIFPQFDKVFAIEKEILKKGDTGYELFYKLSNNTSFSIATCPKNTKILIIHAVEYKRNLDKRIKKTKR